MDARANLHSLGQPNIFLAPGTATARPAPLASARLPRNKRAQRDKTHVLLKARRDKNACFIEGAAQGSRRWARRRAAGSWRGRAGPRAPYPARAPPRPQRKLHRPKLCANFRALRGLFSRSVGPSLTIWANPIQFLFLPPLPLRKEPVPLAAVHGSPPAACPVASRL
jgi:hypothetical protein